MQTAFRIRIARVFVAAACFGALALAAAAAPASKPGLGAPVHTMGKDAFVKEWIFLGPFPNPTLDKPIEGEVTRQGYAQDFLVALGGEAKAVLKEGLEVAHRDESGKEAVAKAEKVAAERTGRAQLGNHYQKAEHKAAYAFVYLKSDRAQKARCYFGSDDSAKVWLNGKLAFSDWRKEFRPCAPRAAFFTLDLRKGLNPLLVKVEQDRRSWEFIAELVPEDQVAALLAQEKRRADINRFQAAAIRPEGKWDFMFEVGKFPTLRWDDPQAVETIVGKFPLTIRWFDAAMNEVKTPEKPGRYAAVVEGKTSGGALVRRALTFYARDKNWKPWEKEPKAAVEWLPGGPIDRKAWDESREVLASTAGEAFIQFLETTPEGAVQMCHLAEMKPLGRPAGPLDTAEVADQDYHLALRRKLLGLEGRFGPLAAPRKEKSPAAPVLRKGEPSEVGMKGDTAARLRAAGQEWAEKGNSPFAVLIARRGVIVFHEAFSTKDRPVAVDTAFPLASITKTITGLMFAQFLDQGLIGADDPVGKFLPGFPTQGEKAVTLRHCLTHTAGFDGKENGDWDGLDNPWMDNCIANGLEYMRPGKMRCYNGTGFNLAGRVMETVSGKSISRLYQENFFQPLGATKAELQWPSLGGGVRCSVEDLARIGQLMLNRGAYGDTVFFSPKTFEQLLPISVKERFPGLDDSLWRQEDRYGFGIAPKSALHPQAGKNGVPKDRLLFSPNTIGHGAASTTVFSVDPDNELVVVVGRFEAGVDNRTQMERFLMALDECLR